MTTQEQEVVHAITAIKNATAMLDMISKGNDYMPEDVKGMAQLLGGALFVVRRLVDKCDERNDKVQFWYAEYCKAVDNHAKTLPQYTQPAMINDYEGSPLFSITEN